MNPIKKRLLFVLVHNTSNALLHIDTNTRLIIKEQITGVELLERIENIRKARQRIVNAIDEYYVAMKQETDELEWYKAEAARLQSLVSKYQGEHHRLTGEPCDPPRIYGNNPKA